jgi:hypothetical protein
MYSKRFIHKSSLVCVWGGLGCCLYESLHVTFCGRAIPFIILYKSVYKYVIYRLGF